MKYKNLELIGTSHIAKQSIKEIEASIEKNKPDIIAVELDRKRLYALLSQNRRKASLLDVRRIGFKGYIFSLIGAYVQRKLGKMVGVTPGSDMLTAVKLARKNKLKIGLIDQDIEVTLKKFSKSMSWKERWRFLVDMFNGIFFRKRELKKMGIKNLDLSKVPPKTVVKKLTTYVKQRYPNIYCVLIEERNEIMAKNLVKIMKDNPESKVLAVVGAGHEEELMELVKKGEEITYSFTVKH